MFGRRLSGAGLPGEGEEGISLVEVMVAMLVLTVALLALLQGMAASLVSLRVAEARQQATAQVTAILEQARALDHAVLAMRLGDPVVPVGGTYDPDGSGPLAAEPVVQSSTGAVRGTPYQEDGSRTVRTSVTQYDDPTLPAGTAQPRRVTVIATFGPGNQEVRQSSLVAESVRGLPLPAFTISPTDVTLTAPVSDVVCAGHTITNIGAPDRHDVVFPALPLTMTGFTMRAYHDADGDGVLDVGEPLLVDTSGDTVPDTSTPTPTDATFPLLICYDPGASITEFTATLTVVVRSLYDSSVDEVLTHNLRVGNGEVLFLHDLDTTADHVRDVTDRLPANPTAPSATVLVNYDTNLDPFGQPGLYLPRDGQTAVWRHQFPAARTLSAVVPATLRLWVAPAAAPGAESLTLRVRTRHLRSNTTVQASLSDSSYAVTASSTAWTAYDLSLPLLAASFTANQYLEVEVGCTGASTQDCHTAYDTTAFPSSLQVRFQ